jgi:hypothetical protein
MTAHNVGISVVLQFADSATRAALQCFSAQVPRVGLCEEHRSNFLIFLLCDRAHIVIS